MQEVIRWVNANKVAEPGTTVLNENVVLGESMGALVARYALRDMEIKGEDHDTRLYISMDGPHQGANIPIALQYGYRHLRRQYLSSGVAMFGVQATVALTNGFTNQEWVSPNQLLKITNSPASRQMLINYVKKNYELDNSLHNRWQALIDSIGFPTQTKNIAISNGSECGFTQDFNPSDVLFQYKGEGSTGIIGDLAGMLIIPTSGTALFRPQLWLGILPGSNRFNIDFRAKAYPHNRVTEIYKGKISYTKKLFWAFPITVPITNKSFDSKADILPYDYYPGGQEELPQNVGQNDINNINWLFQYHADVVVQNLFSFIPTPSAIAIQEPDNHAKFLRSYTENNTFNSAFDSFITANSDNGNNEEHINYYKNNGEWLAAHLRDTVKIIDCSYQCSDIIGADVVCNQETYSLSDYRGPIVWDIYPSRIATINNGVLTQIGNGEATISATIDGDCGKTKIQRTVIIGKPQTTGTWATTSDSGDLGTYNIVGGTSSVDVYVYNDDPTATFSWTKDSGNVSWSARGNLLVFSNPGIGNSASFTVHTSTECGTSTRTFAFHFRLSGCAWCSTVALSPNPAKHLVQIDIDDPEATVANNSKHSNEPYFITITNQFGYTVRQLETVSEQSSIDVSELQSGIYFVIIQRGDELVKRTLIIE